MATILFRLPQRPPVPRPQIHRWTVVAERRKVSSEFESLLFIIDTFAKDLLHFRYWNRNKLDKMYPTFLNTDKQLLLDVNNELSKNFSCVKAGECNCEKLFEETIVKLYEIPIRNFPVNSFLKSFEKVFNEVFSKYEYHFDEKDDGQTYRNFNNSILYFNTLFIYSPTSRWHLRRICRLWPRRLPMVLSLLRCAMCLGERCSHIGLRRGIDGGESIPSVRRWSPPPAESRLVYL